jgi:glutamate-5-semialdehyde dehydrogenase
MMSSLDSVFSVLRKAQRKLALELGDAKNKALSAAAAAIDAQQETILEANKIDVENARREGVKEALIERLSLSKKSVHAVADSLRTVAALADPIGRVKSGWTLPNGLFIEEITVPLGVVAIIYESRPNVTADAFALAYKAGCSALLRGSRAALNSNKALFNAIRSGLDEAGGVRDSIALACGDHSEVDEILQARGGVDVVLPRGGRNLIRRVVENARVPVIETGEGNCHIYVASSACVQTAARIIENAKIQRPGACNAVETALIHSGILDSFAPLLAKSLAGRVVLRCDERVKAAVMKGGVPDSLVLEDASAEDWAKEYLDFMLAVKAVDSVDEAINHINEYGTGHSEAILTNDDAEAQRFRREVDAACVYVNASTRFTDGGMFGFGAELGISTQKFHARGPMGVDALTASKFLIRGEGHIRE